MTPEARIVLGWLLISFGTCIGYTLLLYHTKPKYDPDRVWLVMLGGGALLWAAPAAIMMNGVAMTPLILALAFTVAYTPVAIWQLIMYVKRVERNGHATPQGGQHAIHTAPRSGGTGDH